MDQTYWNPNKGKNRRWQTWGLTLAMLAVLLVAFLFWKPLGENTVQADFGDSSLSLASPDGSVSHEIFYLNVESVELAILTDYGTQLSGTSDGSCVFGLYHRDDYGDYWLFVNTNVTYCMLVTEKDGTVTAANFGNENVTKETVTAFEELVSEAQG
ncbi:MAG: hypothetical protein LIP11_01380 [Clostridiales bacterium]|nr:hypothetical protein [Clostridiales bacterium]